MEVKSIKGYRNKGNTLELCKNDDKYVVILNDEEHVCGDYDNAVAVFDVIRDLLK